MNIYLSGRFYELIIWKNFLIFFKKSIDKCIIMCYNIINPRGNKLKKRYYYEKNKNLSIIIRSRL